MDKLSFNADEKVDKQALKEQYNEIIKKFWNTLEKSDNIEAIKNAIKDVAKLNSKQEEINDSKYVPSPYNSDIKEQSTNDKIGRTKIKFTDYTVASPFVQCNPIAMYNVLKAGREINVLGRTKQDKLAVGEGGLIKLYMYIASIVKRDSNFIRLDKNKVMQYTGIGTNGYAEYLRILNRLNVLAEIRNMRSCYVINHNVIYNGNKVALCEWLNSNSKNKIELKKDEDRDCTYVEIDEDNKSKLHNIFKKIPFEPFEDYE